MELKKEVKFEDRKSNLTLENRSKLFLTGVIEVISFNEEKIFFNTCKGSLVIKGSGLKMNKLDVQNGDVLIVGTIDSCVYTAQQVKKDKETIISRLFR